LAANIHNIIGTTKFLLFFTWSKLKPAGETCRGNLPGKPAGETSRAIRVEHPARGLYIRDGKKGVVK